MKSEDNGHDAEQSASSSRRIWKRGGAQGSSQLALKAMSVLYDAGKPLSRDEIAERLWPQLDAYARDYLEAWCVRRLHQQAKWDAKRRGLSASFSPRQEKLAEGAALRRWLTEVFAGRIHQGSLIRDPDGRFRPGPRAPKVQTMDGQLKRFTPEVRRELEQTDHQNSRMHLVQLEFKRAAAALSDQSPAARAQALWFLIRRIYVIGPRAPLKERELKREFEHLLRVADTPQTQETVIRLATEYLLVNQR